VLPFPAPSLPRQKIFPAQSRKFPALANRENFARTLKALRNLWVLFMKLPEKISNTLQISLRAGNLKAGDRFAPDCLVSQGVGLKSLRICSFRARRNSPKTSAR
jgi:hypothetical protein